MNCITIISCFVSQLKYSTGHGPWSEMTPKELDFVIAVDCCSLIAFSPVSLSKFWRCWVGGPLPRTSLANNICDKLVGVCGKNLPGAASWLVRSTFSMNVHLYHESSTSNQEIRHNWQSGDSHDNNNLLLPWLEVSSSIMKLHKISVQGSRWTRSSISSLNLLHKLCSLSQNSPYRALLASNDLASMASSDAQRALSAFSLYKPPFFCPLPTCNLSWRFPQPLSPLPADSWARTFLSSCIQSVLEVAVGIPDAFCFLQDGHVFLLRPYNRRQPSLDLSGAPSQTCLEPVDLSGACWHNGNTHPTDKSYQALSNNGT